VISGPSGAGKTSVVSALRARRNFYFSVSATTRGRRPGERQGVDYLFVDEAEFRRMIDTGDLLEWAEYSGNLYGTPRRPVLEQIGAGHDVLLDIETQGARQVKELMPEALMIFVVPPTLEDLKRRLQNRAGTDPADAERRLAIARSEIGLATQLFDHLVVNDELERAVSEVNAIMDGWQEGAGG
jgi:guanylate kinase